MRGKEVEELLRAVHDAAARAAKAGVKVQAIVYEAAEGGNRGREEAE